MIVRTVQSDNSYIKATISNNIIIDSTYKNKIFLKNINVTSVLGSSSSQIANIQYDNKLLATIIKNGDI